MTYDHALPIGIRSFCSLYAFAESTHGSIVTFVHAPRLTQQDPGFIAPLAEVTMLDGRLQKQRSFRKRSVLREQIFRLLQ